jgi:hypothetical protein
MKKLMIVAVAMLLLPVGAMADATVEGNSGLYWDFGETSTTIYAGQTLCYEMGPANLDETCTAPDTFCVVWWDDLGWTLTGTWADAFLLDVNTLQGGDFCITAPCDVAVDDVNTVYFQQRYADINGACDTLLQDCTDPTWGDIYNTDTLFITVVEAPPALFILQDSLYYVEQGQTAAYVPFSICNGDPCAAPTDYDYNLVSLGTIGSALNVSATASAVPGGECQAVYGILDAGAAAIGTEDELTIVVWDAATGTVYDTCVQLVQVVEPIPVPLFTAPVVTILVLAMILAAAVIMKRHAVSKA